MLHFHAVRTDRAAQLVTVDSYYDETAADGTIKRHVAPYQLRYCIARRSNCSGGVPAYTLRQSTAITTGIGGRRQPAPRVVARHERSVIVRT